MSLIKQHSQSLDALLAKNFKQNDYKSLQDTFDFVIKNGGLEEIDFTREEGQSFNPRPARIAQIMIKDCSILSVEAIEASLLASIENSRSEISSQAIKIINSIHIEEKINQFSKALSLALILDRARHLHLSCLLYTSPSPRDRTRSRMPSSA